MNRHETPLILLALMLGVALFAAQVRINYLRSNLQSTVETLDETTAMLNTTTSNLNKVLDARESDQQLVRTALDEVHKLQAALHNTFEWAVPTNRFQPFSVEAP